MSQVQPVRLDEDLMRVIEMKSEEERLNKSATIRKFIYSGVEEYLLQLCSQGRVSLGKVGELLHMTAYDLQRTAQNKGINLGVRKEEHEKGREIADKLVR